jgi:hypothetical protein
MRRVDNKNTLDKAPEISDAAKIPQLSVTINGTEIPRNDIIDLQIHYGEVLDGKLTFVDSVNVSAAGDITKGDLIINYNQTTESNKSTRVQAKIENAEVFRDKHNKVNMIVDFVDANVHILKNSYVSKAYKDKSIYEILEDIFKETKVSAKIEKVEDKEEKLENHVTPGNMSVYDYLHKEKLYSAYHVAHDKSGMKIIPKKCVDYANIKESGETFSSNFNPNDPHHHIKEYKGNLSNTADVQQAMKCTKVHFNDKKNLSNKPITINPETKKDTQKTNPTGISTTKEEINKQNDEFWGMMGDIATTAGGTKSADKSSSSSTKAFNAVKSPVKDSVPFERGGNVFGLDMSLLEHVEMTASSMATSTSSKSSSSSSSSSSSAPDFPAMVKMASKMFRDISVGDGKVDYRDIMRKQQTLQIMVEGLNVDRLFSKVNLQIFTPDAVKDKLDKKFSGQYVVTKVVDKFINGLYMQVLHLESADYGSGK